MKKCFIIVLMCLTQLVFAVTVELDLQSAINLAYENNSELKRQRIILDAAERNAKNSYNTLIPSMTLSAGDNYSFPDEVPANSFNLEGNVSLNIKSSLKASADRNKINLRIEQNNYVILKNALRQSVCDSYFEILQVQHQQSLKKENLQILKELYEENEIKYKKGFLSESEYLNSRILYEKSRSELIMFQLELCNLLNNFKLTLGIPVSDEIKLEDDLAQVYFDYSNNFSEEYQKEILTLVATKLIPELKNLEEQKISLEQDLKIKKLEAWGPDLNLSYQASPVFGTKDTGGKFKNTLNAGISIPLENLIPGTSGHEEINIAKDQIVDMDIQISAKQQEVEITLTNLIRLVNLKTETLSSCKNLVQVTQNNLSITKDSYSKGLLDFQSLKNANTEYLEAQLEYSDMVLDILKNFSNIEQISGKLIKE